jgi:hypothetical protein
MDWTAVVDAFLASAGSSSASVGTPRDSGAANSAGVEQRSSARDAFSVDGAMPGDFTRQFFGQRRRFEGQRSRFEWKRCPFLGRAWGFFQQCMALQVPAMALLVPTGV